MPTDVFNSSAAKKKIAQAQRRKRLKELDDVRKILKTPEGRRFFWRLLGRCRLFKTSFTPNSNQTAFYEGTRNIGLDVLNDINEAEPSAYVQMQNEYVSARNSHKEAQNA